MEFKENVQTNNATTNPAPPTVYIPMVVDLESFKENGFIVGINAADVRHNWRVGNRYCDVVLIPATETERREYLRMVTDEFKKEDRDARCFVSDGKGHLIKCPECNHCSECAYNHSWNKESGRIKTFSELAMVNDTDEVTDFL